MRAVWADILAELSSHLILCTVPLLMPTSFGARLILRPMTGTSEQYADDAQHLRRGFLLSQRLIPLTLKQDVLRVGVGAGRV
jgi:hypothetical protein